MRILYFSNISFSPSAYNGGGWIFSLINEVKKLPNVSVAVCFLGENNKKSFFEGLYVYETQKYVHGTLFSKAFRSLMRYLGDYKNAERKTWTYYEDLFFSVINDFKPDIIQIFGSEKEFGLIGSKTKIPVVLHIQGFLNPCKQAYLPPFFSYSSLVKWYDLNSFVKQWMLGRLWKMQAYREEEILKRINHYIGRTDWDKMIIGCYSHDAKYYYGSEILRSEFYLGGERKLPNKLVILSTISKATYKGFDMILKTANVLKNVMHLDFEWNVFGNVNPEPYKRILQLKYHDLNINLNGVASAKELRNELLCCTCYLHPSYIDNSPNSVCEAQILGIPVIACNVGGVSSLIDDEKTGFLIPANDPYQAAYHVKKIFENIELNKEIGYSSKEMALIRHDKDYIVHGLINIYNRTLSK